MSQPYQMTSENIEDVRRITVTLEDSACRGKLTVESLHDAVRRTYVVHGELRSVGIEYIWRNLRIFCELVEEQLRRPFFMQHLKNPDVVRAIAESNILHSIPECDRGLLINAIAAAQPLRTIKWINAAIDCEVRPTSVAKAILAQLNSSKVLMDDKRTLARYILHYGAGWVSESNRFNDRAGKPLFEAMDHRAHWNFLPEDQFFEIIKECVLWAPELMFTTGELGRPNLQERFVAIRPGYDCDDHAYAIDEVPPRFLDKHQVTRLRVMAAGHLMSLEGLSVDMLMELPDDTWLEIAKRALPGSMEFLVRVSLHSFKGQFCFANHFASVEITGEELLRTYRTLYSELHDPKVGERIEAIMIAIDRQFIKMLAEHGYYVGKVRRERSAQYGEQTIVYSSYDAANGAPLLLNINGVPAKIIQSRGQRKFFEDGTIVYADRNTDPNLANRLSDKRLLVFGHLHHVRPDEESNKI